MTEATPMQVAFCIANLFYNERAAAIYEAAYGREPVPGDMHWEEKCEVIMRLGFHGLFAKLDTENQKRLVTSCLDRYLETAQRLYPA